MNEKCNPKVMDILMIIVLAVVAISSIWIGAWIMASQAYANSELAFLFLEKALKFDFSNPKFVVILLQCVAFYGTCAYSFVVLIMALAKKKWRILPCLVAVLFSGFALAICVGFVGVFAEQLVSNISGVFSVVLALLSLVNMLLLYKMAKYTLRLALCKKYYEEYSKI